MTSLPQNLPEVTAPARDWHWQVVTIASCLDEIRVADCDAVRYAAFDTIQKIAAGALATIDGTAVYR